MSRPPPCDRELVGACKIVMMDMHVWVSEQMRQRMRMLYGTQHIDETQLQRIIAMTAHEIYEPGRSEAMAKNLTAFAEAMAAQNNSFSAGTALSPVATPTAPSFDMPELAAALHTEGSGNAQPQPEQQQPTPTEQQLHPIPEEEPPRSRRCKHCGSRAHKEQECGNKHQGVCCWHCKKPGHTAGECPDAKCYNCGKMGHMVRQCSEPRKPSMRTVPGSETVNKAQPSSSASSMGGFNSRPRNNTDDEWDY